MNNAPMYLFNQLQRIQNATVSFDRKSYSRCTDVINLKWLPMRELTEHSIAKLAWKSINHDSWPKFLHMEKDDNTRPRPTRSSVADGTKLRCLSNATVTFENEASKIFNELPLNCRNSLNYKEFSKLTKSYFLDKALARSLA